MSESKAILYKRDTAIDALMSLSNQMTNLSSRHPDEYFPIKLKEVIVFGSFARGAERVHDLDILLKYDKNVNQYEDYWYIYMEKDEDFILSKAAIEIEEAFAKYLKNKKRIISFHDGNIEAEYELATSDTHFCIMKDGVIDYEAIEMLLFGEVLEDAEYDVL